MLSENNTFKSHSYISSRQIFGQAVKQADIEYHLLTLLSGKEVEIEISENTNIGIIVDKNSLILYNKNQTNILISLSEETTIPIAIDGRTIVSMTNDKTRFKVMYEGQKNLYYCSTLRI